MRILLDENFPADFAKLLVKHDVSTVHSLGWSGVKNGELLRRADGVCEVFVTLDRSLEFQQNKTLNCFRSAWSSFVLSQIAWLILRRTYQVFLRRQTASLLDK